MIFALSYKGEFINDGSKYNDQIDSVPYPSPKLLPMKTPIDAKDNFKSKDTCIDPKDNIYFYMQ